MRDRLVSDAESGDPYACLALGYFRQTGKEMDADGAEAVLWYERAAARGCARAHWELYRIYTEGEMAPRDAESAARHLRASAELGNVEAQFETAEGLRGGDAPDPEGAFLWYRRAAEQGHTFAKFVVGYMYSRGTGIEASAPDAEMWFSSAALTGHADMFMRIGLCYEYGLDGMFRSDVEAARWYRYGADMGHDKCTMCWEAVMSALGGGPRESLEERTARLSRAVTQVDADGRASALEAADALMGEGDCEGAYGLYARAAEMGSPEAAFAQAMMLHSGIGVRRDDLGAIRLLSAAANAGSEDAQFYLARTYESSRFPTDDSQIVKLYSDAAANGFLAAYYYLSKYVERPEVYVRRTHPRRRCRSRTS